MPNANNVLRDEKICGEALWEPEHMVCSLRGANDSQSIQSYQTIHKGLLK